MIDPKPYLGNNGKEEELNLYNMNNFNNNMGNPEEKVSV